MFSSRIIGTAGTALACLLALSTVASAGQVVLTTPMGPTIGVDGHNTDNACLAINVGLKPLPSVTITEYQVTYCEAGGTQCHSQQKATVTCTDLQPGDFCRLFDGVTAVMQNVWCQFTGGSSRTLRASMTVSDGSTGQTLAVLPAIQR